MKKTYLIAVGIFLVVVLGVLILALSKTTKKTSTNTKLITPTPNLISNETPSNIVTSIPNVETDDFKIEYSSSIKKMVIHEKTPQAVSKFEAWAITNGYDQLLNNDQVIYESALTPTPSQKKTDGEKFVDFLNLFLNPSSNTSSSTTNNNQPTNSTLITSSSNQDKVYYGQCGEFGNYSLPSGCDLCKSGCGPTTISMIVSSYLNQSIDPTQIVNTYKDRGYLLGCGGSRYTDAKSIIESYGLKTTSFMIYPYSKSEEVAPDFKNYIDNGWTIFALASYCKNGCGHFFWITSVDENNNILAYDPYYGQTDSPPLNENSRYPFPLYRIAFGVKKD